jgi:hypothetical protein
MRTAIKQKEFNLSVFGTATSMRKTVIKKLEAGGLIANFNRLRKNLPSNLPKKVNIWDETFVRL